MIEESDFPHAGYYDGGLDIDLLEHIAGQIVEMAGRAAAWSRASLDVALLVLIVTLAAASVS